MAKILAVAFAAVAAVGCSPYEPGELTDLNTGKSYDCYNLTVTREHGAICRGRFGKVRVTTNFSVKWDGAAKPD